jgi:release factor glutamine methyltransferase
MTTGTAMKTWTVLELINWTTDYFRRVGIENPRLNAEVLLGHVLGLERIMLYARFEQPVGPDERDTFRELVRRRAAREPLQQLVGSWEFRSRKFQVTRDVLTPRPDTEFLLDRCLGLLTPKVQGWVADIGTGSGIIALTLACERPALQIAAVDLSESALAVARHNAEQLGVTERVEFLQGNLLEPLREREHGWEMIVSNPPYIPTAEIERLEPEVREYEPRMALDGGHDGLEVVRRLIAEAPDLLVQGGWLVMELGPGQAGHVRELVEQSEGYEQESIDVRPDGAGHERVFSVAHRREG